MGRAPPAAQTSGKFRSANELICTSIPVASPKASTRSYAQVTYSTPWAASTPCVITVAVATVTSEARQSPTSKGTTVTGPFVHAPFILFRSSVWLMT